MLLAVASDAFIQTRVVLNSMARKRSTQKNGKRQQARPIFDTIRKPTAPPGHPLSRAKPDEIARPAGRKAKHKTRPEQTNDDEL